MNRRTLALPAVLKPEALVAVVDSREQRPYSLAPMRSVVRGLDAGDYSLVGLEAVVRVERKSLPDFVACCGRERERFVRELVKLRGFEYAAVVLEASWRDLEAGRWEGLVKPSVVVGSALSWSMEYVPILLAHDRAGGERACRGFLWTAARHTFGRTRAFRDTLVRAVFESEPASCGAGR